MAEMFGCIPLKFLVPLVAYDGGSTSGQAFFGDIDVVTFHPLWPVPTVTAVNESCAFKEEGGTGYNRSFLQKKALGKSDIN